MGALEHGAEVRARGVSFHGHGVGMSPRTGPRIRVDRVDLLWSPEVNVRPKPLFMSCALALWIPGCGGGEGKTHVEGAESTGGHGTGTEGHDAEATGARATGGAVVAAHHDGAAHGEEGGEDQAEATGPRPIPRDGALEPLPSKRLLVKLRPAARRSLAAILRTQRDGTFPPAVREDSENARLFLVAAMSEEASDSVRVAALDGMSRTWSASASSSSKMTPDEDFVHVVRHHLRSENPRVLAAAIETSTRVLPLTPIDEAVVRDLLILGYRPDPATQFAVLEALGSLSERMATPGIEDLMVDAIGSREPFVSAKALALMGSTAAGVKDVDALREALVRGVGAEDPGVRGRSLRLLAGVSSNDALWRNKTRDACVKALDDPNGFVRSTAAVGLGMLQAVEAIPALVAHLDDGASGVYDLSGWTQLDGSPGFIHHDGSMLSRVDDAVLDALTQTSLPLGEAAFKRRSLGQITGLELLDRQREDANVWMKQHRSTIKAWAERRVDEERARALQEASPAPQPPSGGAPTPGAGAAEGEGHAGAGPTAHGAPKH